jgi:hypothetical protein
VVFFACGGLPGALVSDSDDASAPDAALEGDAAVEASPRPDAGEAGAAPPKAHLSAGGVDLGYAPCGSTTTRAGSLTLENVGGSVLEFRAELPEDTIFSLDGEVNGEIEPGQKSTILVQSRAMPTDARAGVAYRAKLTISTNDPALGKVELVVKVTPQGGALVASPAIAAFGAVPLGTQATDIPIALTNAGNAPVHVGFTQPSDGQFALSWTGAPNAVEVKPGEKVPGLVARFRPTTTAASSASGTLDVTGALCGAAPVLDLSGSGSVGTIALVPAAVYFGSNGLVDCGTTAAAQTVTLSNAGVGSFGFDASLGLGANSPYTVSPSSGTVGPNGSVALTITPKPLPATSLTTADLYADTLTVTTMGTGEPPRQVALHQTARGARLAFDQTSLTFGDVPASTTKDLPLRVSNTGNAPASVTWSIENGHFTASPTSPASVPASGALDATVTFAPGLDHTPQTGTLSITTTDVLCAAPPAPIPLSGTGLRGVATLSASTLDFGLTSCGSQAAAQTLSMKNEGNAAFAYALALAGGTTKYALSQASGSLQPGASTTVTVTPQPIPQTSPVTANLYGDTLTVTTDIPGDTPRDVTLTQTALGVILVASTTDIDFGNVTVSTSASSAVTFRNDGNAQGSVSILSSDAAFSVAPSSGSPAGGGGTLPASVTFAPLLAQAYSGTLTLSVTGAALCAPAPSLSVRGTGTP